MKPRVICHMVCSVDGKIIGSKWKTDPADGNIFEDTAATIKSDGWIVGRVTMSEFSAKKARRKRTGKFTVPKGDYVAPHKQKTYAVGLDPSGKLSWDKNYYDTEHVIAVVTEKVGAEYLDYLRSKEVSYIIGGKTKLDLKLVLEKLNRLFGVKRITVQGGGSNNGSFLNAGLINELSLVVLPFADGETGTQSVFDIDKKDKKKKSVRLKLKSTKLYKKKYMWLKYDVLN
jgi:2,5-diamino-6-(ribosylamino)-4(3H)-pyrimidinone 5'-phosphate reductase